MSANASPSGRSRPASNCGATGSPIRVLIVDDERTFGEALEVALEREQDVRVVDVTTDCMEAVRSAEQFKPDVVLLDAVMPGMSGIEATRQIKAASPDARVLILSGGDDEYLLARAVQAGATGLLRKTEGVQEVTLKVRRAHEGEPLHAEQEVEQALRQLRHSRQRDADAGRRLARLTPRELEILQLMAEAMSPEQIARILGVSPHTLRTHTQNIITKLGVHSKMEALVLAIRHGRVATVDVTEAPNE